MAQYPMMRKSSKGSCMSNLIYSPSPALINSIPLPEVGNLSRGCSFSPFF